MEIKQHIWPFLYLYCTHDAHCFQGRFSFFWNFLRIYEHHMFKLRLLFERNVLSWVLISRQDTVSTRTHWWKNANPAELCVFVKRRGRNDVKRARRAKEKRKNLTVELKWVADSHRCQWSCGAHTNTAARAQEDAHTSLHTAHSSLGDLEFKERFILATASG